MYRNDKCYGMKIIDTFHNNAISLILLVLVIGGCASEREVHQHHSVSADSSAVALQHSGGVVQQQVNVDSIVESQLHRLMAEYQAAQQEHEITTETLTETIDSLGRVIRQQQRTTDRTVSRQEQLRRQEELQLVAQQWHAELHRQDSIWNDRLDSVSKSLRDSISTAISERKGGAAAAIQTPMEKIWQRLKWMTMGICLMVVAGVILKMKH